MAPITFYYMPESPPCRMVQMVASIAGVELDERSINLALGEHLKDEYLKLNPLHKVPFIVDGDLKMNESRAISLYIVNKYMPNDDSFYPKDPIKRAHVDELMFLDSSLWYAVAGLYRPRLFGNTKELNSDEEKKARDYLAYINRRLEDSGKKFILGDSITLADAALATSLTFCEAVEMDLGEFKSLTAYYESLKKSIPNFDTINKTPIENMKNYIRSRMERLGSA